MNEEKNTAKKVYIVIEKDRGHGETICGVYRHKQSAQIEVGDSRSYRYEEHEIIEVEEPPLTWNPIRDALEKPPKWPKEKPE